MKRTELPAGYLASFCRELYLILQAGIPLPEGVEILAEGEEDGGIRQALTTVTDTLLDGYPLGEALGRTGKFPQYMLDMVGVGEETGNLDRGLKALADYYDRQEQLEQNIRRAVLYPALLLSVLTLVLVVLIVEVLPMFESVYAQLGGSLTGLGAVILDFGVLLKANWILAIVLVVALVAVAVVLARRGAKNGVRVLLSKKLGLAVAVSKVTSVLAMAMQSGLDVDMAMDMAVELTQHPGLRQKLTLCSGRMSQGEGLSQALKEEGVLSGLYCRMLGVGIKTGAMDQVMEEIAHRCDRAAQEDMERHISSVEPTLVMAMSLLVGVVLLSVMLPLATIMTALG